jgi:nucleotide-binding universal stress UspA family protein
MQDRVVLCLLDARDTSHAGVRYAATLAHQLGIRLALMHVIEPMPVTHWLSLAEDAALEQERAAQDLAQRMAETAYAVTHTAAMQYIERGVQREQLLNVLRLNKDIVHLVLTGAIGSDPGALISALSREGGSIPVPGTVLN